MTDLDYAILSAYTGCDYRWLCQCPSDYNEADPEVFFTKVFELTSRFGVDGFFLIFRAACGCKAITPPPPPPERKRCQWDDSLWADDPRCKPPLPPPKECPWLPGVPIDDPRCLPCPTDPTIANTDPKCKQAPPPPPPPERKPCALPPKK